MLTSRVATCRARALLVHLLVQLTKDALDERPIGRRRARAEQFEQPALERAIRIRRVATRPSRSRTRTPPALHIHLADRGRRCSDDAQAPIPEGIVGNERVTERAERRHAPGELGHYRRVELDARVGLPAVHQQFDCARRADIPGLSRGTGRTTERHLRPDRRSIF